MFANSFWFVIYLLYKCLRIVFVSFIFCSQIVAGFLGGYKEPSRGLLSARKCKCVALKNSGLKSLKLTFRAGESHAKVAKQKMNVYAPIYG